MQLRRIIYINFYSQKKLTADLTDKCSGLQQWETNQ